MGMENEISLKSYFQIIRKNLILIFTTIFLVTLIGGIYISSKPDIYQAEASIIVLGDKGGASKMFGGSFIPSIASFANISMNTPMNKVKALLESRVLASAVIQKLDLFPFYYPEIWDKDKKKWKVNNPGDIPTIQQTVPIYQSELKIVEDMRLGILRIAYESKDKSMVAFIVNGTLQELNILINKNEFTQSKTNRVFVEKQLLANRKELLEASKELVSYYGNEKNKISSLSSTVDVDLNTSDSQESLEDKISQLQKDKENMELAANNFKVKNVPQQVYLEYLIGKKAILQQLEAYLAQEYEMAKINEAKESLNFQILDTAEIPLSKVGPFRRKVIQNMFIFSVFFSVFIVFALDYIKKRVKFL